ncbi:PAS domain-containing protein [Guptibacillus hwajinpoensis]|uniref:PAS domain-containing protein n=1 Tax=Guptibacillus hwajinpoensis TaxID=208199 RepID=UPI003D6C4AB1
MKELLICLTTRKTSYRIRACLPKNNVSATTLLDGIACIDEHLNVTSINKALRRMLGYSLEELTTRKRSDIVRIRGNCSTSVHICIEWTPENLRN